MTGPDFFSSSYAMARFRFIAAACAAGATMHELHLDAKGPNGLPLATEIAWLGSKQPDRAIIHSSGIHGVEGFAGSAIQLALLSTEINVPDDCAVIFVHCLNPYGMAWSRRFNETNVDLNRNFIKGGTTSREGAADTYRRLSGLLNPGTKPFRLDLFYPRAIYSVLKYGMPALRQAIAEGQFEYPEGLFFGGQQFEQESLQYLGWLSLNLKTVRKCFAIDVHTGLGQWGSETLFLRSSEAVREDEHSLGIKLGRKLVSDPSATDAYEIRGQLYEAFDLLYPKPEWNFVLQEFGTYSGIRVLNALRQENRWHLYDEGGLDHWTKRKLKDLFAPDDRQWRARVVKRGVYLLQKVINYNFGT